ncbi:MAG: hypothetical protein KC944_23285, partial [Candidatus Omnitrophica bacterium]|nr:hypothetical protein [Candidatus Omnitrophota bacterium]
MITLKDIEESIERIDAFLSGSGYTYHYTGGISLFAHGQPRTTQDLDVVISLPLSKIESFLDSLGEDYHKDSVLALQTGRSQKMFQVVDLNTFLKIDFYLGENIRGAFDRTVRENLIGEGIYPTISKEDAIVSKVLWVSKGSGRSEQDVASMLNAPEPFDLALVENLCEQLGIL